MTRSMMRFVLATAALAAVALPLGYSDLPALAQVYSPAPQPVINPTDLIPDTPAGNGQPQATFVNPTQISGTPGYVKAVPVTGFSYTFGPSQSYLLLNPAGTLATGTAITAQNPSDGQRECIRSTQGVTAFTYTPNPAASPTQTINSAPTALSANTAACFTYSKANATWDPS